MKGYQIKSEESKNEDQIKSCAEIVMKAKEIMADAELMKHVNIELDKKKKIITEVQDIRDAKGKDQDLDDEEYDLEKLPEVEKETKDGVVLADKDESKVEIQGPATKLIYTKPKVKSIKDLHDAKNKSSDVSED